MLCVWCIAYTASRCVCLVCAGSGKSTWPLILTRPHEHFKGARASEDGSLNWQHHPGGSPNTQQHPTPHTNSCMPYGTAPTTQLPTCPIILTKPVLHAACITLQGLRLPAVPFPGRADRTALGATRAHHQPRGPPTHQVITAQGWGGGPHDSICAQAQVCIDEGCGLCIGTNPCALPQCPVKPSHTVPSRQFRRGSNT
jgi:hypothetical protein